MCSRANTNTDAIQANNYQGEESETLIGEWMDKRNNREEMVIATKFTTGYRTRFSKDVHENIMSNFQGNHAKSAKLSVEASLKKLRTDYIDLLYVRKSMKQSQFLSANLDQGPLVGHDHLRS